MKFEDILIEVKKLIPHEQEFIMNMIADKRHVKFTEWISVKDRLPENDDDVLGFYPRDGITVCFYSSDNVTSYVKSDGSIFFTNDGWEHNFAWAMKSFITHWMPLPKTPGEIC